MNKNNNFEEIFKESEGSISETRKIQTKKAEIDLDKDGNEKLELTIIDTVGIGDTKLTTQGVLYRLAEATNYIGEGLNQIFFVSGGRFTEKEEEAYRLLSSVIFDSEAINFTTIIRTNFPRFNDEKICKKDREAMREENLRLSDIVNSSQIIYVDNPPINTGDEERDTLNRKVRGYSRKILLTHLGTCQDVYKPNNLNKLNDRINNYMTEKERLEAEIKETQRLMEKQKQELKEQIKEVRKIGDNQARELETRNKQQIGEIVKKNKQQIDDLISQANENKEVISALLSFYHLPEIRKTTDFSSKSLADQVKYLASEFERVAKEKKEIEKNRDEWKNWGNIQLKEKEEWKNWGNIQLKNNQELQAKIQQNDCKTM